MSKQNPRNFGIFKGEHITYLVHPQRGEDQVNLVVIKGLAEGVRLSGIRFIFPRQNPFQNNSCVRNDFKVCADPGHAGSTPQLNQAKVSYFL